MCLIKLISTGKMKAETDLKVYKCLDYNRSYDMYSTPFQFMRVEFDKNGKFAFEMDADLLNDFPGVCGKVVCKMVEKGMHAYRAKAAADIISAKFLKDDGTKTHYAVIPKGSYYYIGNKCDIVSNRMIIFKRKKDFDAYAKENKVKTVE